MLKLTLAAFTALAVPAAAAFQPPRISYESLLKGGDTLRESPFTKALSETGILSVTGIPGMNRREVALSLLRKCAQESKAAREHRFPDGTRRLTMATHTVPGGVQKIDHKVSSQACESFDEASDSFRATVATATKAFANGVAELYGYASSEEQEPLLSTANEIGFKTFSDVVHFGEHLEHFHSYQQMNSLEEKQETIEMHVDQGLFIAFTPGRLMMHNDNVSTQSVVEMTSGFFIELQDGSVEEVKFTNQDDLVFMLGDGVNQYINNKFPANKQLRAVPHALLMDYTRDESYSRVWYGRMVLPPVDALHPAHGTTFGELRDTLIAASLNNREDDTVGVGCSGGMVARDLSATDCGDDATYCWHRCMNHTDFGVSNEVCASRDLAVECINPRQQLWAGEFHGDYYPACADASLLEIETPFPNLEEFPRSEELCTDAEFDAFADADGFEFSAELPGGARFQWSLEGDEVRGRIAYNGLFGWLGFGFANVGGDKNGMHGGKCVCKRRIARFNIVEIDLLCCYSPGLFVLFVSLLSQPMFSWPFPEEITRACLDSISTFRRRSTSTRFIPN
jgi:hypothetical protein